MAVKIRLTRTGRKKKPSYRVVVMDSRKPRDGAYIEQIGRYEPLAEPSVVEIDNERALDWLNKGAQPTERARKLLEISGAWTRFRVSKGDIHTIEAAPTPKAVEPVVLEELTGDAEAAPEPVLLEELTGDAEAAPEPVLLEELTGDAEAAAEEVTEAVAETAETAVEEAVEATEENS